MGIQIGRNENILSLQLSESFTFNFLLELRDLNER